MPTRTSDNESRNAQLGKKLRELRTARDMTQAQVAAAVGNSNYRRYERGLLTMPWFTFVDVIRVLGASPCDFMPCDFDPKGWGKQYDGRRFNAPERAD